MDLSKAYVLDIETNDLISGMVSYKEQPYRLRSDARLWCIVIRNVGTNEIHVAVKEECTREWLQEVLHDCEYLIAHNGIKFDFLSLFLFGIFDYKVGFLNEPDTLFGKEVIFFDTVIMSRLFNPDRHLGHSLESWGDRVGNAKTDFRAECIAAGIIDDKAPRGAEFKVFSDIMVTYCIQDTSTNKDTFIALMEEWGDYKGWRRPLKMENKLADLAIMRENLGFHFDKPLAIECLNDLAEKMDTIEKKILPLLPPKKMGKTQEKEYILPVNQFKKDGTPSKALENRIEKLGGFLTKDGAKYQLLFEDKLVDLPYHDPLKTYVAASLKDLDHIKMFLMELGWVPTEWRERDLTKDAKKQNLTFEKRESALRRWVNDTLEGKYTKARLDHLELTPEIVFESTFMRLYEDRPVRVRTSPTLRVGVEKELCPNLLALGDKVAFAGDLALYLTYKHRKSSIAGGEVEDMDFDVEYPNKGYLSMYREEDGRVPTPSIEIGASCVPEETEILTRTGYKKILEVCIGNEVLTHNLNFKPVIDTIDNGIKPVYQIELESGHILKCTGNHPIMTQRGWVRCSDLEDEDEIFYVKQ